MTTTASVIRKIIFGLTIIFFILLIVGLIAFSFFNVAFRESSDANTLYLYLIFLIPIALLFTMTGTLKKSNSQNRNWGIAGFTTFLAITIFLMMLSLFMQVGFGSWTNEAILYRNNKNKNISINLQIWDVGALGYNRETKRIVELKPFLKYFYQVKNVDTSSLNKSQWIFVNEAGNIHYP